MYIYILKTKQLYWFSHVDHNQLDDPLPFRIMHPNSVLLTGQSIVVLFLFQFILSVVLVEQWRIVTKQQGKQNKQTQKEFNLKDEQRCLIKKTSSVLD